MTTTGSIHGTISVLLLVILGLLTRTTSVTGQLFDANGCLTEGAEYNATSKMCQCIEGYYGVGDLCCSKVADQAPNLPLDSDQCFITGDPYLNSVTKQRVPLNIPCSVCINVMEGTTASNKKCVWEILGSSTIHKHGVMYLDSIKVAISINAKSPSFVVLTGDKFINPVTNEIYALGADGKGSIMVEDETVQFTHVASAAAWIMTGCGHRVVFRPAEGMDKGKPGVCLQSPKDSSSKSLVEGNLCNLLSNFDNSVPWRYGVLNNALNTRLMFTPQQKASPGDYNAICDKIDELMDTFCRGISKEAMVQCGPLLYNSVIRSCLDGMGVKGKDMHDLFGNCLETYCDGSSQLCNDFKSVQALQVCVPSMTNCQAWPNYF